MLDERQRFPRPLYLIAYLERLLTTQALPFHEFHSTSALGARLATPTAPSISSNYQRFQQIGESAFRSKLTPMR
jgi:hypothetical protein